jgi:uncharacterized membrane protein
MSAETTKDCLSSLGSSSTLRRIQRLLAYDTITYALVVPTVAVLVGEVSEQVGVRL